MSGAQQRPLRVGIVGCGFIADIHAANASELPDVEVSAACDLRAGVAEHFARRHGIERWTTDVEALLDGRELDAIAVCTHPPARPGIAVRAAEAGKHLLLEKPMASTVHECEAIARAAHAAGVVVAVDLKFRAAPAVQGALAAVPAAKHVLAQAAMEQLPADSPHMDPAHGGGVIENLGSHVFDLAYVLTASEPLWITCAGLILDDRPVACDVATGVIGHASGALTTYALADVGFSGYASKWLLECFDGERTATITNHARDLYLDAEPSARVADGDAAPHAVGTRATLSAFADAVTSGSEPTADAQDGLRAVTLVQAARESLRSGGARVELSRAMATAKGGAT